MIQNPPQAPVPVVLPARTVEPARSTPFEAGQPARRSEKRLPFRLG